MEKGFYHKGIGYWQTVGGNPSASDYQEGTIEVPLRPSVDHKWIDGKWGYVPQPELTPKEKRELMLPITKRQLRLTLVRNGISLVQVEQSITTMPEGLAKQEAEIEWQDASQFNRLHPTLLMVADALNLAPEQIDVMWDYALTV